MCYDSGMKHIAILGLSLHGNDAEMLRGVFRHAQLHQDWLVHDPIRPTEWAPDAPVRPSGIIANVVDRKIAAHCAAFGVPVVNLSGPLPGVHGFPTVVSDAEAVGRMAAEHLADLGFRSLAWFHSMLGYSFIRGRGAAFEAEARRRGLDCCGSFSGDVPPTAHAAGHAAGGAPRPDVVSWIRGLPRPCGVFATTDSGGRELCRLCRERGLHVPEDVAIVGVDDFEFICETSRPPLSSIRLPNEEIGMRAAELLDLAMARRKVPALTLLRPLGVHVRQSTDIVAVGDPAVARAVAYVRSHPGERFGVPEVVRNSGLNRRTLERRFRDAFGRTVLDEIHRARVATARSLLVNTSLTVSEIAQRAGFRDAQHLHVVYRRITGETPSECRRLGVDRQPVSPARRAEPSQKLDTVADRTRCGISAT